MTSGFGGLSVAGAKNSFRRKSRTFRSPAAVIISQSVNSCGSGINLPAIFTEEESLAASLLNSITGFRSKVKMYPSVDVTILIL
jgi:hypothetical protein